MSDEVLHNDDPGREGNLSADEYWARYDAAVAAGAEPCHRLTPDQWGPIAEDDR